MAYKIKKSKMNKAMNENRAYKMQLGYAMLEHKSYQIYGNSYKDLSEKEKKEIALKVQKEFPYFK